MTNETPAQKPDALLVTQAEQMLALEQSKAENLALQAQVEQLNEALADIHNRLFDLRSEYTDYRKSIEKPHLQYLN